VPYATFIAGYAVLAGKSRPDFGHSNEGLRLVLQEAEVGQDEK